MLPVDWGATVVGVLAGLGVAAVLALTAFLLPPGGAALALVTAQFMGQLGAGYVAARFAGRDFPLHGSYAALGLYGITTSISLAAGSRPSVATLALFAVVAALLGGAGGVLAGRPRPG